MSELCPVKYDNDNGSVFLGRDYNSPSNVSGQVAFEIDQEVRKIIDECHAKATDIITEHKDELIRIAEALMEYETLTAEQIVRLSKGESIEADFKDIKVNQQMAEVHEELKESLDAKDATTADAFDNNEVEVETGE